MYAKTVLALFTITTALAFALVSAAAVITLRAPPAFAAQGQEFIAKLTGRNTRATGSLGMELSPDGTISHYVLNATNLSNFISAQIHEGAKGTNGPVIVTLYESAMNGTMINGTLSEGKVFSKSI